MRKQLRSSADILKKASFEDDVKSISSTIVGEYMASPEGPSLNERIAEKIKGKDYTDEHIKQVVAAVNNGVYAKLFAKTDPMKDRTVKFEIASVDGIKGVSSAQQSDQTDGGEESGSGLDKAASEKTDFRFANELIHTDSGMGSFKFIEPREVHMSKIAFIMDGLKAELMDSEYRLNKTASAVAGTIFRHHDPQGLFNSVCQDAKLGKHIQTIIKEAHAFLSDKELEIYEIDNSPSFSLGEFSQMKMASQKPVLVKVDRASRITDYDSLLKVACELEACYDETINKADELKSKSELIGNAISKLAQ